MSDQGRDNFRNTKRERFRGRSSSAAQRLEQYRNRMAELQAGGMSEEDASAQAVREMKEQQGIFAQ
jgi:uncharacterized protein involved in exopolysaccharide biosynthesis